MWGIWCDLGSGWEGLCSTFHQSLSHIWVLLHVESSSILAGGPAKKVWGMDLSGVLLVVHALTPLGGGQECWDTFGKRTMYCLSGLISPCTTLWREIKFVITMFTIYKSSWEPHTKSSKRVYQIYRHGIIPLQSHYLAGSWVKFAMYC